MTMVLAYCERHDLCAHIFLNRDAVSYQMHLMLTDNEEGSNETKLNVATFSTP